MKLRNLIVLILLSFSCEKSFFHEEQIKYHTIDSEEEVLEMLNGIYILLTKVYDENYFETLSRSDDINAYTNYNWSGCRMYREDIDYAEKIGNVYLFFYKAIVNINKLLPAIKEYNQYSHVVGELHFLRGYSYFKLAQFFKTPPIITDIDVNYRVQQPTTLEVYNFILAEMDTAMQLLPANYETARIPGESPNQGTVKALLAEIYLNMAGYPLHDESKYAEAAALAEDLIQQAGYYNFHLIDDFANLWKAGEYRHNTECVFGLFFNASDFDASNNIARSTGFLSHNTFTENRLKVLSKYQSDFMFFEAFPNSYRKYKSFNTGYYTYRDYDTLEGTHTAVFFKTFDPIQDPCSYVSDGGAVTLKWFDPEEDTSSYYEQINNVTLYLHRFAQTILTYAEAKARAGQLDASCYEAVNQIRRRANHVDINLPSKYDLTAGLTTEEFLDSVVWERAWELCTEPNGRWFDIVRLELKDEIEANRYPEDIPVMISEDLLTDDGYFYLIPQEDRWLNPNYEEQR